MHRLLTIVFLCMSMALAWWALELQGKLVFKEKELLTLRKDRDAAQTTARQALAEIAPLKENVARLQKERDESRALAGKAAQSPADITGQALVEDANAGVFGGFLKQLDSPEMKNMMRTQQLGATRKEYGALLKRWNLSQTDSEAVLGFLADKEIDMSSETISLINGSATANATTDPAASLEKHESESKERLKSILGEARMKELAAYDQERESEQIVGRHSEHLDIAGFPLNAQQRTQLAGVIQQVAGDATAMNTADAEELKILTSGTADGEMIAKMRKREEEQQTRILQKSAGFLTPDQVSALQSSFREQNEEQQAGLKMMQQMFKAGGGIGGGGAVKVEVKTKSIDVPAKP